MSWLEVEGCPVSCCLKLTSRKNEIRGKELMMACCAGVGEKTGARNAGQPGHGALDTVYCWLPGSRSESGVSRAQRKRASRFHGAVENGSVQR